MKEWDNVNKANKAIGVIEGVAAGLRDGLEGLLIASCEVIDETLRDLMTQSGNDREEHLMDQNLIHTLLKDKDDLLTENSQLRDMLEKMATEGGAEAECDDEIATSATPPRNDSGCLKVQTDNPSVACGDSSPCTGEPLGAAKGCEVCKGMAVVGAIKKGRDGFALIVAKEKRLMAKIEEEERIDFNIEFCPFCGRKL